MPRREPTERVTLTLRMRESLRAELEAAARRDDQSLNNEIASRLELSLKDEAIGNVVFGDLYVLFDQLGRIIRGIELKNRAKMRSDGRTYFECVETIHRFLLIAPQVVGTGSFPDAIRDVFDAQALTVAEMIIRKEAERKANEAEDVSQRAEKIDHA